MLLPVGFGGNELVDSGERVWILDYFISLQGFVLCTIVGGVK